MSYVGIQKYNRLLDGVTCDLSQFLLKFEKARREEPFGEISLSKERGELAAVGQDR